jgi:hypothetical protein|tara:strand:- start:157 stop:483 length:327 start_codon:yes stop_codon:yes gene_type:complete
VSNLTNQQIEDIVDKVIKKVWERVAMWGMVVIAAFVLVSLELNKAKADEASITPKEFGEAIVAVPGKVSNFAQSEWQKTKEYQAESWADMRVQFISTKEKIINLFSKK